VTRLRRPTIILPLLLSASLLSRAMPTSSAAAAGRTHVHAPTPRITTASRQMATSSQIMMVVAAAERATGTPCAWRNR
jgi:hypothetical protein